jgi:N-carbamoylputrescine amidase
MTTSTNGTIKLAAVQVQSQVGDVEGNLFHATRFVEEAAALGASVVALPELFSCGYVPNRSVWDSAEPANGRTAEWLATTAHRLGIYLGCGTVETDGTDFFNAFTLADPTGQIAGRAYKANAEANVFKRGMNEHIIRTPIGLIGVGICADNQFAAQLQLMHEQQVDIILMPHAWPTPSKAAGLVSEADVAAAHSRMVELPALYARSLGVPVVFVNQVGPFLPIGGILGQLMDPKIWRLRGQSRIVDSDGSVLGQMSDEEGILVVSASLDQTRKHYLEQPSFGGWLQPGSVVARKVFIPFDILTGRLSYSLSRDRKRKAQKRATLTSESVSRVFTAA